MLVAENPQGGPMLLAGDRVVVPRLWWRWALIGGETAAQNEWGAWGSKPEPTD